MDKTGNVEVEDPEKKLSPAGEYIVSTIGLVTLNFILVFVVGALFSWLWAFGALFLYIFNLLNRGLVAIAVQAMVWVDESHDVDKPPGDLGRIYAVVGEPAKFVFKQAQATTLALIAAILAYCFLAPLLGHTALVTIITFGLVDFILRKEISTTQDPVPYTSAILEMLGLGIGYYVCYTYGVASLLTGGLIGIAIAVFISEIIGAKVKAQYKAEDKLEAEERKKAKQAAQE